MAIILLETHGRKLGDQDHQYYNELVARLLHDTKHVQSIQNLWGKPVTMSGQQSADAEVATVAVRPTGDQGDATANQSVKAIRDIVAKIPKPSGLDTYVTGPAPLYPHDPIRAPPRQRPARRPRWRGLGRHRRAPSTGSTCLWAPCRRRG